MTQLTDHELHTLRSWTYKVEDHSVLCRLLQPVWNFLVELFPRHVHPNLISLAGFLCVLYLFVLSQRHEPSLSLAVAVALLSTAYTFLDALDGKQARRTHSASVVGELFDHALDNLSMVLLLLAYLTLCGCALESERFLVFSTIFSFSVLFLSFHLDAYLSPSHTLVFGAFSGQNEAMAVYALLVLYAGARERLFALAASSSSLAAYLPLWQEIERFVHAAAPYALNYLAALYLAIQSVRAVKKWRNASPRVPFSEAKELHAVLSTAITYAVRLLGVYGSFSLSSLTHTAHHAHAHAHSLTLPFLCEGFILSIPTTEMILCKMSGKPFSALIPVLAMASIVDDRLALLCTAYYYLSLFYTLTVKLSIPFLRPRRRLYCCGVFDMCHRGHMLLFQRCASLAEEVVVGVVSCLCIVFVNFLNGLSFLFLTRSTTTKMWRHTSAHPTFLTQSAARRFLSARA